MDRQTKIIGEFGNLWDGVVEAEGTSKEVNIENLPHISIMVDIFELDEDGNKTDDKTGATIEFEGSPDGEHWTFCALITEDLPQDEQSEAHVFHTVGVRYIRLKRDDEGADDVYIQATVQAKP